MFPVRFACICLRRSTPWLFALLSVPATLHPQLPVDLARLVFPSSMSVALGSSTPLAFGRVFMLSVTETPGPAPTMAAEFGYGPDGSDPATSLLWTWVTASYNVQSGNEDEYVASAVVPGPGTFDYAFRFRDANGPWTYGDLDGSQNGYSPGRAGDLVVIGQATPPDTAQLVFPSTMLVAAGSPTPTVFGRVAKAGFTAAPGPDPGMLAQLGYGPDGTSPQSAAWIWVQASYNAQLGAEDEYSASLLTVLPGQYDYAFRFSHYGSAFLYGDLDGSQTGYSSAQAGAMTVAGLYPPLLASGCQGPAPLSLAVTGSPTLGGAVTSTLTGLGVGVPFLTWNFGPPGQVLLPACACQVSSINGWLFGASTTLVIPQIPGLLGAQVLSQGAELLPANPSCVVPASLHLTDIWLVVVQ